MQASYQRFESNSPENALAFFGEDGLSDDQVLARALMNTPLWSGMAPPDAMPSWAQDAFDQFANSDLAQETSFGLITDWYRQLVPMVPGEPRSAFGEKADILIATQPDNFWKGDPVKVMDRVAELAGWERDADDDEVELTIADFILETLENKSVPVSISEFEELFKDAGYSIPSSSIRGRLNELTSKGEIQRVDRGLYA
ncbi:MAG: hypothetical protein AAF217_06290, partial [Pseudomonadota bacterium]